MVELAPAACLAVLTRAPSAPGKRRLFAELGQQPDPALRAALLADTIDAATTSSAALALFVEPPERCGEVAALAPPGARVLPQEGGTLGERMRGAFAVLFEGGAGAVVLIGSDLPEIDRREVARAFEWLQADPSIVVLGPASDGGYYLLGATHTPELFDGVEWGTPGVLRQTVLQAARGGTRVRLLAPASDVDGAADLQRIVDGGDEGSARASRTRAWALSNGITTSRGSVTSSGRS